MVSSAKNLETIKVNILVSDPQTPTFVKCTRLVADCIATLVKTDLHALTVVETDSDRHECGACGRGSSGGSDNHARWTREGVQATVVQIESIRHKGVCQVDL